MAGQADIGPVDLRQALQIVTTMETVPGFLVMTNPDMPAADRQRMEEAFLTLPAAEAGRQFFALSGFKNIRPVDQDGLAKLDAYVDLTRRGLFGER